MSKSLKLVFLASLVLNLLLFGVLLGRMPYGFGAQPSRQQRMDQALKNLPEPVQTRFRERLAQIRAAGDPLRKRMDAARQEVLRIMSADNFDEAAYDRQIEQLNELRTEMFKRMSQTAKQTIEQLSPEDRRTFTSLFRRPPPPKKD